MPRKAKIETISAVPYSVIPGRKYLVPYIRPPTAIHGYEAGNQVPIIGELHEDTLLGFPYLHFHHDRRFIPPRIYNEMQNPWEALAVTRLIPNESGELEVDPLWVDLPIKHGEFTCHRQMPEPTIKVVGLDRLEKLFKFRKLENRVCPHKRVSLSGMYPDNDWCLTCPGHGLKWNANTGDLVQQIKE